MTLYKGMSSFYSHLKFNHGQSQKCDASILLTSHGAPHRQQASAVLGYATLRGNDDIHRLVKPKQIQRGHTSRVLECLLTFTAYSLLVMRLKHVCTLA